MKCLFSLYNFDREIIKHDCVTRLRSTNCRHQLRSRASAYRDRELVYSLEAMWFFGGNRLKPGHQRATHRLNASTLVRDEC